MCVVRVWFIYFLFYLLIGTVEKYMSYLAVWLKGYSYTLEQYQTFCSILKKRPFEFRVVAVDWFVVCLERGNSFEWSKS